MDLKQEISARLAEKMATDDETRQTAIEFYSLLAEQGNEAAIEELEELENDDDGRYDAYV